MSAPNTVRKQMGKYPLPQALIHVLPFVIAALCFLGCVIVEILGIVISREERDQFYRSFGDACYYSCILLSTLHCRKYGVGWFKSLLFSYLTYILLLSYLSGGWTDLDILIFGTGTVAAFRAILALPILCLIFTRFCQVDTLNLCDALTPYCYFFHGIVTVACWIEGCCAGKPQSWGLLNPLNGMTVFPLQPCIILLSVAVGYWGLEYAKKHSFRANGLVFANSLIIYGCGRYILELFSDDPRIFWVVSWLGVCALMSVALGFLVRWISGKHYQTP